MRVLIYDWHGGSRDKLKGLNLEHNTVVEMTTEQILGLTQTFQTLVVKKVKSDLYDLIVGVTVHSHPGAR
jgi:hypothetical protein